MLIPRESKNQQISDKDKCRDYEIQSLWKTCKKRTTTLEEAKEYFWIVLKARQYSNKYSDKQIEQVLSVLS